MNNPDIAGRIGRGTGERERVRLVVDGHVHIHPEHDEKSLVKCATDQLGSISPGLPTLLLTETSSASAFKRWRNGFAGGVVRSTGEDEAIIVDEKLLVVAGRQVVTQEKIEVLAIGTAARFKDGLSLEATLDEVENAGGIAVLPWGLGKWLGFRGKAVAEAAARRRVLLGDNAGRPFFWPAPGIFRSHPVLPGTDPLNAPGEERFVGSYGFSLDCDLELDRPVASIKEALRHLEAGSPARFGKRIPFPQSVIRQVRHFVPKGKAAPKGSHGKSGEVSQLVNPSGDA